MTNKKKLGLWLALMGAVGLVVACSTGCGEEDTKIKTDAVSSYAELVEASYKESLETAQMLNEAIKKFTANPSAANLEAAKQAWIISREPYLQTEVYRFYEGPIDNEANGPEGLLNAWPMDEHFVDYVEGDENAGLINDLSFEINPDNVEGKNEFDGEKNIATGYHAIEFLLWGQDTVDGEGAGNRPYTDYVIGDAGTAKNQERRAKYLEVVGALLVKHLGQVTEEWAEDGAYRKAFLADDANKSIEKMLIGMIVLAGFETGGERLQAALDSGDKEDEHSCFSDNTHRDMIQDIQGISNVFHGTYTFQDGTKWAGTGLKVVISDFDIGLAAALETEIAAALTSSLALKIPFENEIKPNNAEGNGRVLDLIVKLRTIEKTLETVFVEMGFSVPAPE